MGFWLSQTICTARVSLRSDMEKAPCNPARGFYIQIKSDRPDRLAQYSRDLRLCLLAYDLHEFRDYDISEEKLAELETFLREAAREDMKCIFRAAYGFDRLEENDVSDWAQLERHVRQIAPILNQYRSQIYCVQAGFLGPWGEWHSSKWLDDANEASGYRKRLTQLLLSELDEEIVVCLRRPRFIREADPQTKRLAFFNDGLLASESDLGTYDSEDFSREQELLWMEEAICAPQNGGEMPKISPYTEPENVEREFQKMKISYLNSTYNEEVLEDWKEKSLGGEDAYSYLSKRIGYRYYLSSMRYPRFAHQVFPWVDPVLKLTLTNEGFSPIDHRFCLEVILENEQGELRVCHTVDSLGALEQDGRIEVEIPVDLSDARRIGIRISEKSDAKKKTENCVQLVNKEIGWNEGIHYILFREEDRMYPLSTQ